MKQILVLAGSLLLASCRPTIGFHPQTATLQSDCPKQATCEIKIIPGKSMLAKNAESTTYTLEDNPAKNVVIYKYAKIVKGDLQDAGYREEIVFELDRNVSAVNLSDGQIQNTKMLYGRFCFCKGQTGYYPVRQGQLSIDANHNGHLDFTIPEVPQITKQIQFSLK